MKKRCYYWGMNHIKEIRVRLGVSQAELAKGIGVTQGNVLHYEKFRQTIPPERAKRVIRFAADRGLAIDFEDIYGHAGDPPIPEPTPDANPS